MFANKNEEIKKIHELNKPHNVEQYIPLTDPNNIIELSNVSKSYQSENVVSNVLHDVNLNIKKGEFVVILGPSGGGKTTLMNIISGLDRATNGIVNVLGTNLIALNDDELTIFRRENISYVFQQYGLLPNLTVKENIQIGSYLYQENIKTNYRNQKKAFHKKYKEFTQEKQNQIKLIQQQINHLKKEYLTKVNALLNDKTINKEDKQIQIKQLKQEFVNLEKERNEQILKICSQQEAFRSNQINQLSSIKQNRDQISINEILDLLELTEQKDKFPAQLSGGQQQRVSIARAIIKNANILFADEPTGAVDNNMSDKILDIFKVLNTKYHKTIIIVTHNPEIAKLATKVVHIKFGTIQKIEA